MTATTNPRDVSAAEFPRDGSAEDKLHFLLNYATLAPSTHNTQPWKWEIANDEVALYADRSRLMPALDPSGRELVISCGAALQHLRLAIRAFGYTDLVSILPDHDNLDLLAYVRLAGKRPAHSHDCLLFANMPRRHTNRQVFDDRALPEDLIATLHEEAAHSGAWLYCAPKGAVQERIIDLITRGDIAQSRDKATRRDVADWIRSGRGAHADGIPAASLGLNTWLSYLAPLSHRLLDLGESLAGQNRELAASAPALVVLGTETEDVAAWIAAGEALARVLLRASDAGVSASFFSQPIQVNALWVQLRHVIGRSSFPQLIFRLGYADEVPATPRRSVDEVTANAT